jgi:hypothetical protein
MLRYFVLPLAAAALSAEPSVVKIVTRGEGFQLLRNGQPYFIKGGGGGRYLEPLVAAGGNSIRTYAGSTQLDELNAKGVSVLVGLPVGLPRSGFDYGDAEKIAAQRARVEEAVRRVKDHPAVLMWALGNEVELAASDADRIRAWKEIEQLAKLVHRIDTSHPVIAVLAGPGKTKLAELAEHCPSLDAVGINTYGGMMSLPEAVASQHWKRAWLVTEFGPRGHWEVPKTPWGLPIEDTSTEKADFYLKAYQYAVPKSPACLGSYVFLWGQKQEKTHTWYGMFLPDGKPLGTVDAMQFAWTGKWPANRAPRIEGRIKLVGLPEVAAGATLDLSVAANDPDDDTIAIEWDLRRDVSDNPGRGGDREPPTPVLATASGRMVTLKLPAEAGNYRVFVYVTDPGSKAATANLAVKAR